MSLWTKPKRQLTSKTIKDALEANFVKLVTGCYHVLPLRCMFNDKNLEKCQTQIAARRRVLEIALMRMEEVIVFFFIKFTLLSLREKMIRNMQFVEFLKFAVSCSVKSEGVYISYQNNTHL